MKATTLVRLATAGNRTDVLRTALTAVSAGLAVLALLAAVAVAVIRGQAYRYGNPLLLEPGLRPGVVLALVLLALPVLALAGQCIRLGAPARDRRLAAFRLAGATPREAVLIATAETVTASLLGAVLGLAAYLVLRRLLTQHDRRGMLVLPTDVQPPLAVVAVLVICVPLLAGFIGAILMRRVITTPLGVVRRVRTRGPRPWPGLFLAVGLLLFWLPERIPDGWRRPSWLPSVPTGRVSIVLLIGAGIVLIIAGVVLGMGWISHTAGRLLRRFGRRAATLLAGQRLITDPWSGSRTMATLLAAVVAGAIVLAYWADMATQFRAYDRYNILVNYPDGGGIGAAAEPGFYFGAMRLVLVAIAVSAAVATAGLLVAMAEGIVARRRTYAALTATGVPRRTLAAALLWQTLTPLLPALLLALVSGVGVVRLIRTRITVGGDYEQCIDPANSWAGCATRTVHDPLVVLRVPVPVEHLALLGGGALLAVLAAVGAGLFVLRASTHLDELRAG